MTTEEKQPTASEAKAVGHELASVLPNDGLPWWKKSHLIKLNFCIVSFMLFTSSNGFDGSVMNGFLALPQWKNFMDNPTGAWLGFINAVYSLGAVIGYPLTAMLCNRWGRKIGLWLSVLVSLAGTALQTAAPNQVSFIIARLLMGLSQGLSVGAPLLIAENAFPTHRGIASSIYNTGWYVGAIVAAWATFGTRNMEGDVSWRIPSGLMALLPLMTVPALFMMDESPRWLVSMDRADEARQNLAKSHCGGNMHDPLVAFEMAEIEEALQAEKEANDNTSWADLWSTPGNRHRLWISVSLGIFAQWSGNGVVSYYLALILESVGIRSVTDQTLISGCLQIWNLIWSVAAAACVDKVGRKALFMTSGIIMLVSYIIVTGLSGSFATTSNTPTGLAVVPFLFIYFLGYDLALTPLVISYPVEIWTYQMRARGLAICQMVSLGAIFFNTFINPIALDAIQWKYYFVFVAILVAMLISVWFTYPETRGRTLESIAWLFDGEDANVGIVTADNTFKSTNHHIEDPSTDASDAKQEATK
ncbi:sugar transporter [Colletotrichum karsti]|uniref:Sugar transporter n=1 Tax=Colletotrichum karsti TaxID=1095194 RepID=A0A9P6LF25_9PEZI|nr:sugar transporter [Colletotrichum karsti]KAF9871048.1 sugar transporter [Colletotrichum karsti]